MGECKPFEYDNVNGFKITLDVDDSGSPKTITFTIKYKNKRVKVTWPKLSLICVAVLYFSLRVYLYLSWYTISVSAVVFAALFLFWATHSVQSESLTVIPTIGLESSVKYVFGKESKFVAWSNIDDVIINEVIKMNSVLYFLTVLEKERPEDFNCGIKVVPLFSYTKPKLVMIEKIYSEIRQHLMQQVHNAEINSWARKNAEKKKESKAGAGDVDSNELNEERDESVPTG